MRNQRRPSPITQVRSDNFSQDDVFTGSKSKRSQRRHHLLGSSDNEHSTSVDPDVSPAEREGAVMSTRKHVHSSNNTVLKSSRNQIEAKQESFEAPTKFSQTGQTTVVMKSTQTSRPSRASTKSTISYADLNDIYYEDHVDVSASHKKNRSNNKNRVGANSLCPDSNADLKPVHSFGWDSSDPRYYYHSLGTSDHENLKNIHSNDEFERPPTSIDVSHISIPSLLINENIPACSVALPFLIGQHRSRSLIDLGQLILNGKDFNSPNVSDWRTSLREVISHRSNNEMPGFPRNLLFCPTALRRLYMEDGKMKFQLESILRPSSTQMKSRHLNELFHVPSNAISTLASDSEVVDALEQLSSTEYNECRDFIEHSIGCKLACPLPQNMSRSPFSFAAVGEEATKLSSTLASVLMKELRIDATSTDHNVRPSIEAERKILEALIASVETAKLRSLSTSLNPPPAPPTPPRRLYISRSAPRSSKNRARLIKEPILLFTPTLSSQEANPDSQVASEPPNSNSSTSRKRGRAASVHSQNTSHTEDSTSNVPRDALNPSETRSVDSMRDALSAIAKDAESTLKKLQSYPLTSRALLALQRRTAFVAREIQVRAWRASRAAEHLWNNTIIHSPIKNSLDHNSRSISLGQSVIDSNNRGTHEGVQSSIETSNGRIDSNSSAFTQLHHTPVSEAQPKGTPSTGAQSAGADSFCGSVSSTVLNQTSTNLSTLSFVDALETRRQVLEAIRAQLEEDAKLLEAETTQSISRLLGQLPSSGSPIRHVGSTSQGYQSPNVSNVNRQNQNNRLFTPGTKAVLVENSIVGMVVREASRAAGVAVALPTDFVDHATILYHDDELISPNLGQSNSKSHTSSRSWIFNGGDKI